MINDFLLDAAIGDRRLCLSRVLQLKPSVTAINDAFVAVCKRHNYCVATMLSTHINQQGFDESFFTALEDQDFETLQWLLRGRYGFLPNQDRLNDEYRQLTLRNLTGRSRYEFRNITNFQQQAIQLIKDRIPSDFKTLIMQEIEAKRQVEERRNRQKYLFHIHSTDIHSYSAASIEEPIVPPISPSTTTTTTPTTMGAIGENMLSTEHELNDDLSNNNINNNNNNNNDIESNNDNIQQQLNVPSIRKRISLNEAIVAHMNTRVIESINEDIDQTMAEMLSLIRHYIPTAQQENAIRLLGEILNTSSVKLFATTLTFLKSFGSSSRRVLETWIQGFLSESVVMHSCNPGALERVVTGLRGINDPQLDKIFSQAEAPQLINIFIKTTFNIFYDENDLESKRKAITHAEKLAIELVSRGATEETDSNDIQQLLLNYANSVISSYDANTTRYRNEALSVIEIVVDNYETHLKPYVITFQSQRNNNINKLDESNDSMNIETKENK